MRFGKDSTKVGELEGVGGRRKKSIGTDVGECEVEEGVSDCEGGAWGGVRSEE